MTPRALKDSASRPCEEQRARAAVRAALHARSSKASAQVAGSIQNHCIGYSLSCNCVHCPPLRLVVKEGKLFCFSAATLACGPWAPVSGDIPDVIVVLIHTFALEAGALGALPATNVTWDLTVPGPASSGLDAFVLPDDMRFQSVFCLKQQGNRLRPAPEGGVW